MTGSPEDRSVSSAPGFTAEEPCLPPHETGDPVLPRFRGSAWIWLIAASVFLGAVLGFLL